ncbi:MAG TPA: hypothetical protein VGF58_19120 [Burkholderiales bacterium]|jgi:hypothetical protein
MRPSVILQLLVLRKALNVCGPEETLARKLSVGKSELRGWLTGDEAVPLSAFNRALHLVNRAYRQKRSQPSSTQRVG